MTFAVFVALRGAGFRIFGAGFLPARAGAFAAGRTVAFLVGTDLPLVAGCFACFFFAMTGIGVGGESLGWSETVGSIRESVSRA